MAALKMWQLLRKLSRTIANVKAALVRKGTAAAADSGTTVVTSD
ncbi:hypothetical protein [Streptomyces sp. NPDC049944]